MKSRLALRRVLLRALSVESKRDSGQKEQQPLVLVGLSGGADSLALAAALAAESRAKGAIAQIRGGAIVVDHGLQQGSADIAERAAAQARDLGLDPVIVKRVAVGDERGGGPESAAREARYAAFSHVAAETGAVAILTAHTRDDQAEQVLLALSRGSGTKSIAGIPIVRALSEQAGGAPVTVLRPFLDDSLEITRATTEQACEELGLEPWFDPHNTDRSYARVRVREDLLPLLEKQLGGGIRAGLARSADLAREDAEALDAWAVQAIDGVLVDAAGIGAMGNGALGKGTQGEAEAVKLDVVALAELPAAVRQRVIHRVATTQFGASLSREHTLAIAALVTGWRGQGPIFVPGIRVTRVGTALHFEQQLNSPRDKRN